MYRISTSASSRLVANVWRNMCGVRCSSMEARVAYLLIIRRQFGQTWIYHFGLQKNVLQGVDNPILIPPRALIFLTDNHLLSIKK